MEPDAFVRLRYDPHLIRIDISAVISVVILSAAAFQAERRISVSSAVKRQPM